MSLREDLDAHISQMINEMFNEQHWVESGSFKCGCKAFIGPHSYMFLKQCEKKGDCENARNWRNKFFKKDW